MAITINGTTGVAGVDGSNASPAIQGTDSNTGLSFASDTVNINTGGVLRATVDSSGNLNIPDGGKIQLGASQDLKIYHDSGGNSFIEESGSNSLVVKTDDLYIQNAGGTHTNLFADSDGAVSLSYNGTSHFSTQSNGVKVDSAGDTILEMHTSNAGAHNRINFSVDAGDNYGGIWYSAGYNRMEFRTNNAERMVINNDGVVDIYAAYTNAVGGTTRDLYVRNDGRLGYLSSVRASKTNIVDLTNISWLNTLKPKTFNFRKQNDLGEYTDNHYDELEYGLIAEDVESVNKELCTYSSDNVLEAVQYRKLVVPLLKAVQDLTSEVEVLKTKVAALEAA